MQDMGGSMPIADDPFDFRDSASSRRMQLRPAQKSKRSRCGPAGRGAALAPCRGRRCGAGHVSVRYAAAGFHEGRWLGHGAGGHIGVFPAGGGHGGIADTGEPENPYLRVGFIPITCATPLMLAAPTGIYAKQGLKVELVKTPGWAVIRDRR